MTDINFAQVLHNEALAIANNSDYSEGTLRRALRDACARYMLAVDKQAKQDDPETPEVEFDVLVRLMGPGAATEIPNQTIPKVMQLAADIATGEPLVFTDRGDRMHVIPVSSLQELTIADVTKIRNGERP
jgi:hypothetical protein